MHAPQSQEVEYKYAGQTFQVSIKQDPVVILACEAKSTMTSGRLVAAITTMFSKGSEPSISERSWLITRASTEEDVEE